MGIINYYEKYGISQTDALEQIQWVINQKIIDEENDSFGEGHSDKMFILQLAKEAFATSESRARYDTELVESQKKSDPDGERKVSFKKWYGDAQKYYNSKQYDLAKTAIDHAMQYTTPETVDSAFYDTAASIHACLKLYSQALDFENQSVVLSPEDANGYYLKAFFLHSYIYEKNLGNDKMQDIWKQLKSNCELTISKVIAQERGYIQASQCYEFLSEMYYVYANNAQFPITGRNNALAEDYALKAISILNGSPNDCPLAKKILDDIVARRAKIAELEKTNANLRTKLKNDNGELEQKNENLRNTVSSQKSSIDNATTYGNTGFGGEKWAGGIAAIIGLICLSAGAAGFGLFLILIAIAVFGIKGAIIAKNKNIRDTLASIRDNESKINSNSNQINHNSSDTDYQMRSNDEIIAQQSAGLAPRPSVHISASPQRVDFGYGFITKMPLPDETDATPYPSHDYTEVMYVPVVLVASKIISDVQDILPLLESVVQQEKELLIFAEDVVGAALATLYVNKLRGTFNSIPIKVTNKSDLQKIASLTGSQILTGDLKTTAINQLGIAREATITANNTVVTLW